jgi:hypothetical protein
MPENQSAEARRQRGRGDWIGLILLVLLSPLLLALLLIVAVSWIIGALALHLLTLVVWIPAGRRVLLSTLIVLCGRLTSRQRFCLACHRRQLFSIGPSGRAGRGGVSQSGFFGSTQEPLNTILWASWFVRFGSPSCFGFGERSESRSTENTSAFEPSKRRFSERSGPVKIGLLPTERRWT